MRNRRKRSCSTCIHLFALQNRPALRDKFAVEKTSGQQASSGEKYSITPEKDVVVARTSTNSTEVDTVY